MPRPPRTGGTWAEEYRRRVERNRGLPTAVARGHGPVPIRVARGIEAQIAGRPRALPVKTQVKYREGIGAYEKAYRGGLRTGHTVSLVFPSERAARRWLRETKTIDPDSEYVQITGGGNEWQVILLR